MTNQSYRMDSTYQSPSNCPFSYRDLPLPRNTSCTIEQTFSSLDRFFDVIKNSKKLVRFTNRFGHGGSVNVPYLSCQFEKSCLRTEFHWFSYKDYTYELEIDASNTGDFILNADQFVEAIKTFNDYHKIICEYVYDLELLLSVEMPFSEIKQSLESLYRYFKDNGFSYKMSYKYKFNGSEYEQNFNLRS